MAVTTAVDNSVLGKHVALMMELAEVLKRHGASGSVRLLLSSPSQLEVSEDEVLVQTVTSERTALLSPVKLSELTGEEVLFDTQVVDPSDSTVNDYASNVQAASCLVRYNLRRECVHIYD